MARALRHRAAATVMVALLGASFVPAALAAAIPQSPYAAARREWFRGACLTSATRGRAWDLAATDLQRAHPLTSADRETIVHLRALVRLPDAMQTPQQRRDGLADTTEIDHFFHTRLLLSGGPTLPPC